LIVSLTTAVLASSSIAGATIVRTSPVAGRPVFRQGIRTVRPFANTTPRTTFVAGGATLPALAYEGKNALTEDPSVPSAGSIFGEFAALTGVTVQYCQTGSGYGRKVFDGNSAAGNVNGACAPLGVKSVPPDGFGAPAALALTNPDITGSDVPLAQSEYSLYLTDFPTRGEPVSIPSVIGSVALLFNYPKSTLKLNLTDSQICEIVEGKITNWSQLVGGASEALTFVDRSDGSGTTFSFSNHLSKVCGSSSGLNTSQQFSAQTGTTPPYVQPNPPSNFVSASGNSGVTSAIVSTPYSIGYVEAANALSAETATIRYATVNGKDPVKDLPQTAAALTYAGTIVKDEAVVTTGGPATVTPLTGVAKAGCVQIAVPSSYADVTKGYPIVAITNLLFASTGNGTTNATNLRELITELNTPSLFGTKITTVNAPTTASGTGTTGYAALGSSFNSSLEAAAAACIGA
jgi:ABC-type phosphate transport system substrate-binding protein